MWTHTSEFGADLSVSYSVCDDGRLLVQVIKCGAAQTFILMPERSIALAQEILRASGDPDPKS